MIDGEATAHAIARDIARDIVAAATRRAVPRVPFLIDGREVGSVATHHLGALAAFADVLRADGKGVELIAAATQRDAVLSGINRALRASGLIRAWRDETYALRDPQTLQPLALIERAASRFWGTLTYGAHATGFVVAADGRPGALWIARRSPSKATDPGLLDNMVGGGVPFDQTPQQALQREAWEEAGLGPELAAVARPAGALALQRDVAEGLQHEWLHCFDIELPPGLMPQNQDGEVAAFELMSPQQLLALIGQGAMTVDSALVTLHFLQRHHWLPESQNSFDALATGVADTPAHGE